MGRLAGLQPRRCENCGNEYRREEIYTCDHCQRDVCGDCCEYHGDCYGGPHYCIDTEACEKASEV